MQNRKMLKISFSVLLVCTAVIGVYATSFADNNNVIANHENIENKKKNESTQILTDGQYKKKLESLIEGARLGLEETKEDQKRNYDPEIEEFVNDMEEKLNQLEEKKEMLDENRTQNNKITKQSNNKNDENVSYKDLIDEFRED